MFYSWLVPHSFGSSLVLPIQQVQDFLAPSMGAFFGACNMAGGCWGWRLGALKDEVNNWRWHFVEGYMLSTIGAWCEKDVIADQIPSTLDSASCVWHLRLAMAGVSFGLLEFRSPKLLWHVGLTNVCPLGILANYGRLLEVPTWSLQGAQALSQSPFGSVTTAAWLQQGVSSSADTRHRWENNAGTFQIGKQIDFTLYFWGWLNWLPLWQATGK